MNLSVDIMEEANEYIVNVAGEIDVYTAPTLKKKLLPLTEEKGSTIRINLENTTYLDSTGLGVFISAYKSSTENDSTMELSHLGDRVLRLFQVTGLDEIMNVKVNG